MGDRLFASAASMLPQAGMSGVATIAPFIVAGMLANTGIEYETENL